MEEDQSSFNTLSFVNKKLSEDQKLAVSVALKRKNMAIIQGPPGTGKTTTLIEIINQLVKEDKRVRIKLVLFDLDIVINVFIVFAGTRLCTNQRCCGQSCCESCSKWFETVANR